MAENSKIEWTDHTFNPWVGCMKVSPACDRCYAEAWAKRSGQDGLWAGERRRTSEANWKQPLIWNRKAKAAGIRAKVFCASLADVFDNQVPDEWRVDLWRLIEQTPDLDWLLLTKRPQNASRMIVEARRALLGADVEDRHLEWPWPNVWLGTTVENQAEADRRIPHLLSTPAAVRFLSCEPVLDRIWLKPQWVRMWPAHCPDCGGQLDERDECPGWYSEPSLPRHAGIDWVICGGESGPGARPMHPDWVRTLRDQCKNAEVPFFFKQWGEWWPQECNPFPDQRFAERQRVANIKPSITAPERGCWDARGQWTPGRVAGGPPAYTMWRVGKKAAGATLDGREWRESPHA